jgi:hypothetical protein
MVVSLAGRCAEKLVMGEGELTGLGTPDLFHANMIAREMVLSAGMGRKVGSCAARVLFVRVVWRVWTQPDSTVHPSPCHRAPISSIPTPTPLFPPFIN